MNLIIPFEGKVEFDYSVKEICSISLEHEYTLNKTSLLGNFIITGTCKEHELSVNTTDFKFTVPFSVDLPENIDSDSINLAIDNFVYSLEDTTLNINIDYLVNGTETELENLPSNTIAKEIVIPEISVASDLENSVETQNDNREKQIEEKQIIINHENNINFADDFITYQIHIIKDSDTIEEISKKYDCDWETISKLNNITNLVTNNKLIIPIDND